MKLETLVAAIAELCHGLFDIEVTPEITRPEEQFGDFATTIALRLAKRVGRPPRDIAQQLAKALHTQLGDQVTAIEVAGPGFLNIRLADKIMADAALAAPHVEPQVYGGQTILTEYSDPNPFKPLHAGHLYTTLVGDSVSRLIERAGGIVVRINYGGDVGLHVAKNMWAIMKHLGGEVPEKLASVAETERPQWLGARYVEGNAAYENDPAAKVEIIGVNKRIYRLHAENDHTSPFAHIYWTCRQWSYEYFATLYAQLEVKPFDRYIAESEVTPLGLQTVTEQLAKGVYERNDGAVIFDAKQQGLHTRVFITSEGLPTYEAKDVGLSLTKWRDYHFDKSIIITANEQAQYMQVVIASIKKFALEPATRTIHLTHGMVRLQGGVKISSRKGNGPSALDILAAARTAGAETGTNPSEETILAAVKYAFAKTRIGGDIIYDPEESVALEGNSGPYLQYAHARARSILRKIGDYKPKPITSLEPAERSFVRKLSEYPEVLERAMRELLPHYICTYLYETAQQFNAFYEHNRVVGDVRETIRAQFVDTYCNILRDGLDLLGIVAPESM